MSCWTWTVVCFISSLKYLIISNSCHFHLVEIPFYHYLKFVKITTILLTSCLTISVFMKTFSPKSHLHRYFSILSQTCQCNILMNVLTLPIQYLTLFLFTTWPLVKTSVLSVPSAVVGSKAPWVLYFWCGLTGTYFIWPWVLQSQELLDIWLKSVAQSSELLVRFLKD